LTGDLAAEVVKARCAEHRHFTDPEVAELGLITGAFLMLGRLHLAFGVADMPPETHRLWHGLGEHEENQR